MNIEVPKKLVDIVKATLVSCGEVEAVETIEKNIRRYGKPDSFELNVARLKVETLSCLYEVAKESSERGLMMQITSVKNVVESPLTAKVGNLKALVPGVISFLKSDIIDGWLYSIENDGVYVPWLVKKVEYEPARQMSPANVKIVLTANAGSMNGGHDSGSKSICIYADDIVKKTIPEILAEDGYFHESEEFKAQYEIDVEAFAKYRQMRGEQFTGCGMGIQAEKYKNDLIEMGSSARLVNDEDLVKRKITELCENEFWEEEGLGSHFNSRPLHCRLLMFHLGLHENVWVHVSAMKPYVYRPELKEKLVLPDLHRDLIDILANDMDVIMSDVVDGKSGGTTILCKGAPGLGKTLTSEIFCEVIKKPLYRVHSGQLGVNAASVEKALEVILNRAQRWGAVLLLDEADVFVRERGNDIDHNAVVSSFLRTLEYFSGLLFMTTNRANDIDDAILSRCIAVIQYEYPSKDDTRRIWKMLIGQFDLKVEDSVVEDLLEMFKKVSGRDIKELLKLTSKFARRKGLPLNAEVFRQCAMFRGL
jgi:ATPase family associated with various cellular activities (AAA)